jgi:hypothetical protein
MNPILAAEYDIDLAHAAVTAALVVAALAIAVIAVVRFLK